MGATVNIQAIIETAIYVDDLQATETFYRQVLGLPVIGKLYAQRASAGLSLQRN